MWTGSRPVPLRESALLESAVFEAHIKTADRQAKSEGSASLAAFRTLRRRGGPAFQQAVLCYKAKCMGVGKGNRRLSFDWVSYERALQTSSRVQTGSRLVWMKRGPYIKWRMEAENKTQSEAALEWEELLVKNETGKVSPCKSEVLVPIERFVISMTEAAYTDAVKFGTKAGALERQSTSTLDGQNRA